MKKMKMEMIKIQIMIKLKIMIQIQVIIPSNLVIIQKVMNKNKTRKNQIKFQNLQNLQLKFLLFQQSMISRKNCKKKTTSKNLEIAIHFMILIANFKI